MVQNRIARGEHGEIVIKQQPNGSWLARVQVRDIDGRVRSVRVSDRTRGQPPGVWSVVSRNRIDPTITGVTPGTTLETLAGIWLQHRKDHGKVRTKGPLALQTLATYNAEIEHVIVPAAGRVQVKAAA